MRRKIGAGKKRRTTGKNVQPLPENQKRGKCKNSFTTEKNVIK